MNISQTTEEVLKILKKEREKIFFGLVIKSKEKYFYVGPPQIWILKVIRFFTKINKFYILPYGEIHYNSSSEKFVGEGHRYFNKK